MLSFNPKDELSKILTIEWQAFTQKHPHLAGVIDTPLLIEHAADLLEDDPDYLAAMEQAAGTAQMSQAVIPAIARFVKQFLAKLVN